jgi:hypothetical protein
MLPPTPAPAIAPIYNNPIATPPVVSPTENCLDGRTSEQYLLDILVSITPNLDVLLNPASSQGQAFNFLLNDTLIDGEAICSYATLHQRYGLGTYEQDSCCISLPSKQNFSLRKIISDNLPLCTISFLYTTIIARFPLLSYVLFCNER